MGSIHLDSNKLALHPERVSEWKNKGDCFPIYVEIGLTNRCNHNCIFCGLDWARGTNTLETSVLLNNLNDMKNSGIKSVCFSGAGEPLLHKDFSLLVKKTKESGIDVSFSTNAVLFNEKICEETLPYASWIRFSIDAAYPKTHSIIHRTSEKDFPKILNNLVKSVEIKKKNNYATTLGVQFLLLEENKTELLEFVKLFQKIGVDNVQLKPYSKNPNSNNALFQDYGSYLEFEKDLTNLSSDTFQIFFRKNRINSVSSEPSYDNCLGLPFFTIINEKGDIAPCHLYYSVPDFSYGNLYKNNFSEIWAGDKRKEIVEEISRKGINHCKKGCRLDSSNSYLHRLKNPEPHDNFI